jgi:hypothetical protein
VEGFRIGGRRVETRYLERTDEGWQFAAYQWSEDEDEANLAPERGTKVSAEVAPGVRHAIPSRFDRLSGHPAEMKLPPAPSPSGPWIASVAATMTAWSGPWGVSYTANLTPDPETGTRQWTEQEFVDTLRSGRHLGRGREILPPMPWAAIRNMTDDDLKGIFAYLRTIPPIKNRVPDPLPPAGAGK